MLRQQTKAELARRIPLVLLLAADREDQTDAARPSNQQQRRKLQRTEKELRESSRRKEGRNLLDHAVFRPHHLDLVRIVVEFAWGGGEQAVHDGRVCHQVRPETDGQWFDVLFVLLRFLRLLQQVLRQRQHDVTKISSDVTKIPNHASPHKNAKHKNCWKSNGSAEVTTRKF